MDDYSFPLLGRDGSSDWAIDEFRSRCSPDMGWAQFHFSRPALAHDRDCSGFVASGKLGEMVGNSSGGHLPGFFPISIELGGELLDDSLREPIRYHHYVVKILIERRDILLPISLNPGRGLFGREG